MSKPIVVTNKKSLPSKQIVLPHPPGSSKPSPPKPEKKLSDEEILKSMKKLTISSDENGQPTQQQEPKQVEKRLSAVTSDEKEPQPKQEKKLTISSDEKEPQPKQEKKLTISSDEKEPQPKQEKKLTISSDEKKQEPKEGKRVSVSSADGAVPQDKKVSFPPVKTSTSSSATPSNQQSQNNEEEENSPTIESKDAAPPKQGRLTRNLSDPTSISPKATVHLASDLTAAEAEKEFLRFYPDFANEKTKHISALREQEYSRLDKLKQVYMDYTGGGIYGESQLQAHLEMLQSNLFGNPHSINPASMQSTKLVEEARASVLAFFHADPKTYDVIFTSNSSGGLHLLGESFPFSEKSVYLLANDNHNSVNGIREYAKSKGAAVKYCHVQYPNLRLEVDEIASLLQSFGAEIPHSISVSQSLGKSTLMAQEGQGYHLFAYPAQSNFSGVQHSLDLVRAAQENGWYVLLDTAAYVPTSPLDLSSPLMQPDFMCVSFYKMFGYPTGIGALIAKRKSLKILNRPFFGGGTVEFVTVGDENGGVAWMHEGHEAFEDGTVDYLGIPAVKIGLDFLSKKVKMDCLKKRVRAMVRYLLVQLTKMAHSKLNKNSNSHAPDAKKKEDEKPLPMIQIYGPPNDFSRGGTIAFNVFDNQGTRVPDALVEKLAMAENLSLRSGCFCNPGGSACAYLSEETLMAINELTYNEEHQKFTQAQMREMFTEMGGVRVSVGVATNFKDLYTFVCWMHRTFTDKSVAQLQSGMTNKS